MPLVSVIIPNYNHQKYLKQRIDSVLGQTFQDFELIILDDCSTDSSAAIIEEYARHPKVSHIIINAVNSNSTFKQWHKGINLAVGKYIWVAESDDWCEPGMLEVLVNALQADDACVFAYVQSHIINDADDIMWQTTHRKVFEYVAGTSFIQQHMLYRNAVFNASMAVFRKDVYETISPAFTQYKFCGDWLFWIEASLQGKVYISGRVLNYFRKHDQDITGKVYATGYNFLEEVSVLKTVFDRNIINGLAYKKALLRKYFDYQNIAKGLPANAQQELQKAFYGHNGYSYANYLKTKYLTKKIKNNVAGLLRSLAGPSPFN
ncbi:glycosyltransferase family 2 protein [Mucilaginibacter terrae]|uniref:glycosyltransferase family 2 protein n=1 Tax=Mucilaginibacter terrae TaxID=1955052 RepID=UPI00362CAFD1